MNTATHTPTPWDLHIGNADSPGYFKPADVDVGGHYRFRVGDVEARHADAAFIVRACNAHDELVAALRDEVDFLEGFENVDCEETAATIETLLAKKRAALAKAGA